jgi:hypothetical protein
VAGRPAHQSARGSGRRRAKLEELAQGMGLAETLFPSLVGAVIGLSAGYIMVKVMDRFFSNSSVETL